MPVQVMPRSDAFRIVASAVGAVEDDDQDNDAEDAESDSAPGSGGVDPPKRASAHDDGRNPGNDAQREDAENPQDGGAAGAATSWSPF
jgi:hypothetical protein